MSKSTKANKVSQSTIPAPIFDYIESSLANGVEVDLIKVGLVSKHQLSFNKAGSVFSLYLKETGQAVKRVGFTAMFHAFLLEGTKTPAEVGSFIEEHGSANTKRHESIYQNEALLTNAIWAAKQ